MAGALPMALESDSRETRSLVPPQCSEPPHPAQARAKRVVTRSPKAAYQTVRACQMTRPHPYPIPRNLPASLDTREIRLVNGIHKLVDFASRKENAPFKAGGVLVGGC